MRKGACIWLAGRVVLLAGDVLSNIVATTPANSCVHAVSKSACVSCIDFRPASIYFTLPLFLAKRQYRARPSKIPRIGRVSSATALRAAKDSRRIFENATELLHQRSCRCKTHLQLGAVRNTMNAVHNEDACLSGLDGRFPATGAEDFVGACGS